MISVHEIKATVLKEENGKKNINVRRQTNKLLQSVIVGGAGNIQECDTIIVGGGLGGLYLASKIDASIVLERRIKTGGKIRTTVSSENKPLFDDGPWRIHESHSRCIHLVENELSGVKRPNHSSIDLPSTETQCMAGLSTFGSIAYKKGIPEARKQNIVSGYDGISFADCASNVYHGQRHENGQYYFVEGGMKSIVDKLKNKVGTHRIRTGCLVEDIKKVENKYTVLYNTSQNKQNTIKCNRIILCIPPEQIIMPSIQRWCLPVIHSIKSVPLMHVYVRCKTEKKTIPNSTYVVKPEISITQIISGDLSMYFQISYTAGETAIYLRDLHLNYPDEFRKKITEEFHTVFDAEEYPIDVNDANSFHVRFWNDAVHFWRPILGIAHKTIADISKGCTEIHPTALPRIYVCGEAYSTNQGWMEGVLETAEFCLERIKQESKEKKRMALTDNDIVIDGRIIDIERFKHIHPGSINALLPSIKKDGTSRFNMVGHPPYAYGYLLQLQRGFL
jgi:hypothetical protein